MDSQQGSNCTCGTDALVAGATGLVREPEHMVNCPKYEPPLTVAELRYLREHVLK